MESTLDFATYTLWSAYGTIAFLILAILGFIFKWGFRFRFVGATGFMIVLTIGLFGLSLGLFGRPTIPNAVRFNLVYDNGANQAVIAVPIDITPTEIEATLQQAAVDLFSYGRNAMDGDDQLTVRARVQYHGDGVTYPLYLGQLRRSLYQQEDANFEIQILDQNLARLKSLESQS
jgi:hypothetical protein